MPDMNNPISMPIMAMIGRIAFGMTCRVMMRSLDSPFARAVLTRSWLSTSIIEDRIIREYHPAPSSPSVIDGSTRCEKVP